MTTYQRFEDLPVWKKAADLAGEVFQWTNHASFRGKGDLGNQLQRATLSISNNIAEGFERGTTNELLQFIYIARGSAGEVRSMLCVMQRMEDFAALQGEIDELKSAFENVSRQLRGWANSLQNNDVDGPRHLNDRTRDEYARKQRRKAYDEEQREIRRKVEQHLREQAERRRKSNQSPDA